MGKEGKEGITIKSSGCVIRPADSGVRLVFMIRKALIRILIFSLAMPLLAQAQHHAPSDQLPMVGSRVRVTTLRLGPGWHVGMLNRLRVQPVCYVVLVFGLPNKNEVTATLTLSEVRQIQVSNLFNNGHASYDPSKPSYPDEKWADVPLETLRSANKCRRD